MINRAEQNWPDDFEYTSEIIGDDLYKEKNNMTGTEIGTAVTRAELNCEINETIIKSLMTWARYEIDSCRNKITSVFDDALKGFAQHPNRARLEIYRDEKGEMQADVFDADDIVFGGLAPIASTNPEFCIQNLD